MRDRQAAAAVAGSSGTAAQPGDMPIAPPAPPPAPEQLPIQQPTTHDIRGLPNTWKPGTNTPEGWVPPKARHCVKTGESSYTPVEGPQIVQPSAPSVFQPAPSPTEIADDDEADATVIILSPTSPAELPAFVEVQPPLQTRQDEVPPAPKYKPIPAAMRAKLIGAVA